MKISIRTKLVAVLFGSILLFVLITLLLNSIFLKPYYKKIKEESLNESYQAIIKMDFDDVEISKQLESLEQKENIQILIIDNDRYVFFCSSTWQDSLFLPVGDGDDFTEGDRWFRDWLMPDDQEESSVEIFSTKPGFGTRYNSDLSASYLSLYAKANIPYQGVARTFYVIVNTPFAAIEDGVDVANRFALIIGFCTLILGSVAAFIVGTRFVKPIYSISDTARRMTQLNFSEKLAIRSNDELGQLADSINILSDQLESKILELSVTNYQLRKELKHKEDIDNMRREFISDVSHELKTPLSIIMGYCEGLQMNINSDEKDYYCSVIEDEAIRMNKLAMRLLKLAELESGEVEPEMVDFSLSRLVSDRLGKLKYLLDERGIASSMTSDTEEDYIVRGDPERIEEVVNNLLTNAKNHTPDNGRIDVSLHGAADSVTCEVYNSGSHIPQESIDKIWESFYKVDKARSRSYGGSGLGLKIVSTILQTHSADYGVRNTEDGVVFYFTLRQSKGGMLYERNDKINT